MIRDFPDIKQGWWQANVAPDLTAPEVLKVVEREHPGHPSLPQLRTIARNYERAKGREQTFRCHVCRDSCWRENADGTASKCRGAMASGCPADAKRLERLRERYAKRDGTQA